MTDLNKTNDELPLAPIDKSAFIREHASLTSTEYRKTLFSTAVVVIYSATAVASSTSLLLIPNLETITIFIFLVSLFYGFRIGLSMMLTTTVIFELFASIVYGAAGYLFPFKLTSYFVVVLLGSFLSSTTIRNTNVSVSSRLGTRLFYSVIGIMLTLLFDMLTTIASLVIIQDLRTFVLFFIGGIPFFLFHELTNGILFFFVPDYLKIISFTTKDIIREE